MKFRQIQFGKDYPEICEWWRGQKWPHIPKTHLPETGYIVEDDNHKLAAAWLYLTGTQFAMMEFLIVNPNAPIKNRSNGIKKLLKGITDTAVEIGVRSIFTSSKASGLIRLMQRNGFSGAETGMTNMVWRAQ